MTPTLYEAIVFGGGFVALMVAWDWVKRQERKSEERDRRFIDPARIYELTEFKRWQADEHNRRVTQEILDRELSNREER